MQGDAFQWCRRIFASVDVVGSTAYKLRHSQSSGGWANVFKMFFDEFPTTLRACFVSLPDVADGRPTQPMRVWKFVGDEILFVSELGRHEEVVYHVLAFKAALNEYERQFEKKLDLTTLSLKGTVWGAGFPVSNAEVVPTGQDLAAFRDYLGPCIDQGFRLCSLADGRRIPLSVDIAYMLSTTPLTPAVKLMVQCEEPKLHRGVPAPYPHIWLDRLDGAISEEDKLLRRPSLHEPHAIKPYLEELFLQARPGLFKPFLTNDPSVHFKDVPPAMASLREQLIAESAEKTYSSAEVPLVNSVGQQTPPGPKEHI